jgi:hypothetical protein
VSGDGGHVGGVSVHFFMYPLSYLRFG